MTFTSQLSNEDFTSVVLDIIGSDIEINLEQTNKEQEYIAMNLGLTVHSDEGVMFKVTSKIEDYNY